MAALPKDLQGWQIEIEKIAKEYGLDFFPTIFEIVSYKEINKIASYGGFPVRYPHWKFGMEYEHISKSYQYGLSKIYEMVVNTNPCYAYLLEGNSLLDQKLVMAHVYGHNDFFKNNIWFQPTNRKMMDQMANHGVKIRRFMEKYGHNKVEAFIDVCLSLENLIDRYNPPQGQNTQIVEENKKEPTLGLKVERSYMEKYINPPQYIEEQRQKYLAQVNKVKHFPPEPVKDILQFLMDYAPLTDWQVEVLSIIRNEAYYFAPQGMTKIMNEGWASYWHAKMLTEKILNDSEVIEFADKHAGVMQMAPNGFNPYKIGIELFRNIEERWNRGQFGKEWNECDNLKEKKNWDKKLNLGREKIFEARKIYNDISFVDEFLTEDFCRAQGFFVKKFNRETGKFEIDSKNFKQIKNVLLFKLTNFGQPIIKLVDANFENKGEMLLNHQHEGMDLQPDFMEQTMKNLFKIWTRPIHLVTVMEDKPIMFSYNGQEFSQRSL